VNPRGCASKPLKSQLLQNFTFLFHIANKSLVLGITRYAREPKGKCFKTIEKLPLRGFSFLFLAIHPS
jgi:hypothetical protein